MVVVAVAGGTSGIGRAVVEAIKADGKHEPKILGRKSNSDLELELDVPIIAVDYDDIAGVTKTLESNNVHTVISAMTFFPSEGRHHEIELIRAAEASSTTQRMVSSDYAVPFSAEDEELLITVKRRHESQAFLKTTKNLEWTIIHCGFLLDYYGYPHVKTYMKQSIMVLDIPNNTASIPGTGDIPVTFTHTFDTAKYVSAMIDLPKWDPVTSLYAERTTFNEMLKIIEEIKGTKFKVVYDSLDKLKNGHTTLLPSHALTIERVGKNEIERIMSVFSLWLGTGTFNLDPEKRLNESFPNIKPMHVRDLLVAAWGD